MSSNYETLKQLDDKSLELSKSDLKEKDSQQTAKDIQTIRNWILSQKYMKSRVDDEFILSFLRFTKFDQKETQEMIKDYWITRSQLTEYFTGRNLNEDSVLLEIADTCFFVPLPELDSEGRIVLIERITGWDPVKHDYDDLMKYIILCMDVLCENPRCQINGVVQIMDCTSFTAAQIAECTPSRMQKTTKCLQDMYPFKLKELNYYNYPKIFDAFFPTFKMFLKEKVKNRLIMHGSDLASLHKNIPKSILPAEYGGTAGTLKEINERWVNYVLSKKTMIIDMELNYGVDLSQIRPKSGDKPDENKLFDNSTTSGVSETLSKLN